MIQALNQQLPEKGTAIPSPTQEGRSALLASVSAAQIQVQGP